jgi:leucyl-tRNA synthetase
MQNYDKYVLVMFPYPSAAGLHVGHYYNYAIVDSYCRWLRYKGETVFQPFGYDAFGLPTENYAKKHGREPREVTYENIDNFRKQMSDMNTEYEEKLITSDTEYYKWTQWLFLQLKEKGLAYKKLGTVNWCTSCETVLANEQVKNDCCDRCKSEVVDKEMEQWYFKTTEYKDRLINNLEKSGLPEHTIKQQRHWLENLNDWCVSRQRSWGCPIPVEGETDTLDTFVCSSFYWLRYLTESDSEFLPKGSYKQPDLYIGGNEHACMHLIYARFINMFLYDLGIVEEEEPFKRVIHQGMITRDNEKMSKSAGNAVNPDEYNPDELRAYLMFIGHYFDGGDWNDSNIKGIRRFIGRLSRWLSSASESGANINTQNLINSIDNYVDKFKFNKVISDLMTFYNNNKNVEISKTSADEIYEVVKVFLPGFKLENNG